MTDKDVISLCPEVFLPFWRRSPVGFLIIILSIIYVSFVIHFFGFSLTKILGGLVNMKPILAAQKIRIFFDFF